MSNKNLNLKLIIDSIKEFWELKDSDDQEQKDDKESLYDYLDKFANANGFVDNLKEQIFAVEKLFDTIEVENNIYWAKKLKDWFDSSQLDDYLDSYFSDDYYGNKSKYLVDFCKKIYFLIDNHLK